MNYKEKVQYYIQKWTMSDLQGMSELAFDLTCAKQDAYEERKALEYNQELARIAWYKEYKVKTRKDWKSYTDTQADKLGKEQAMKEYDYRLYENSYRLMSALLDRILERKIEVQSINKYKIDSLPNNT